MADHFVEFLAEYYPAIREIWLFGSRANNSWREDSDWDYLAFADQQTLVDLRSLAGTPRVNSIDLFICWDGDQCEGPWALPIKRFQLSSWGWTPHPNGTADYTSVKAAPGFSPAISRAREAGKNIASVPSYAFQ